VDESALRVLLKEHGGWTLKRRRIARHTSLYYYAARKIPGVKRTREIYLCNVAALETISPEVIVAKLEQTR